MPKYEQMEFDFKYPTKKSQENFLNDDFYKETMVRLKDEITKEVQTSFEARYSSYFQELKKKEEEIIRREERVIDLEKKVVEYESNLKKEYSAKSKAFEENDRSYEKILNAVIRMEKDIISLDRKIDSYYSVQKQEEQKKPNPSYLQSIFEYKSNISKKRISSEERTLLEKTTEILSGTYQKEDDGKIAHSWKEREDELTKLVNKYSGIGLSEETKESVEELKGIVNSNKYLSKKYKRIKQNVNGLLESAINNGLPKDEGNDYFSDTKIADETNAKTAPLEEKIGGKIEEAKQDYQKVPYRPVKGPVYKSGLNPANKSKNKAGTQYKPSTLAEVVDNNKVGQPLKKIDLNSFVKRFGEMSTSTSGTMQEMTKIRENLRDYSYEKKLSDKDYDSYQSMKEKLTDLEIQYKHGIEYMYALCDMYGSAGANKESVNCMDYHHNMFKGYWDNFYSRHPVERVLPEQAGQKPESHANVAKNQKVEHPAESNAQNAKSAEPKKEGKIKKLLNKLKPKSKGKK